MLEGLFKLLRLERKAQDEKWGVQNHADPDWCMILGEEVGEANQAALEAKFLKNPEARQASANNLKLELIQVAAVCLAWYECIERREAGGKHD